MLEPDGWLANGVRITLYRVGMLALGLVLVLSDWITWSAFACAAADPRGVRVGGAVAPRASGRSSAPPGRRPALGSRAHRRDPKLAAIGARVSRSACSGSSTSATKWSTRPIRAFWGIALGAAAARGRLDQRARRRGQAERPRECDAGAAQVGALMELLAQPYIWPVLAFILIFKLGDASMGFMVKPFWVDAGFTATEIGLVSVNIGLGLSIAGRLAGGWSPIAPGIFKALWTRALSRRCRTSATRSPPRCIPYGAGANPGALAPARALLRPARPSRSPAGLGTAAFLAFLMAIVDKRHSATEYALLSSVFALSRSVAGSASGFGAEAIGYAPYSCSLTFLLSFPAYLLLPWVKQMLAWADARPAPSP